jgi:hypothetical protein
VRIQTREDGISIDQVVLSPQSFISQSPGASRNDSTVLPEQTGGGSQQPAPTISSISPSSGPESGGAPVTITGTGFAPGAAVRLGGAAATGVNVVSGTRIDASTPPHAAGAVDVVVTNSDGQSGVLPAGFTYTAPTSSPQEVVLYASEAPTRAGNWTVVADSTAAGEARIVMPDSGMAKLNTALANPAHFFEMTFNAQAGVAYRLWIRGKAENDHWGNDSVFVQFSDSVDGSGNPVFRIGTSDGTPINLEDCSGCGLQGWGWQDNGWGVGVLGPLIRFATTGVHTIRIQVREDGLSIDQIVLSPQTYLQNSPGLLKNDSTMLPRP